jgi:hypothetical protein
MSKKKPKPDPQDVVLRIQLPPQKRQRASAQAATKRKKFSDVPGVQQTLFSIDQGGAR